MCAPLRNPVQTGFWESQNIGVWESSLSHSSLWSVTILQNQSLFFLISDSVQIRRAELATIAGLRGQPSLIGSLKADIKLGLRLYRENNTRDMNTVYRVYYKCHSPFSLEKFSEFEKRKSLVQCFDSTWRNLPSHYGRLRPALNFFRKFSIWGERNGRKNNVKYSQFLIRVKR